LNSWEYALLRDDDDQKDKKMSQSELQVEMDFFHQLVKTELQKESIAQIDNFLYLKYAGGKVK
jgi:hypothetical protein